MFLQLYLDNIVIIRKPTGTTSCANHLIHNMNALQREPTGTNCIDSMFLLCKAFNPQ